MNELVKQVKALKNSSVGEVVDKRLKTFARIQKKSSKYWFFELCFCLLTANTSAELGLRVQKELGMDGFFNVSSEEELAKRLKYVKYRFYNRRAHFIYLALEHKDTLKKTLSKLDHHDKREWLVKNIKGIGYKESSHFLRNIGFLDYAILDKHILRLLHEGGFIDEIPKSLNKNNYEDFENILDKVAKRMKMSQGELDFYLWYIKTGSILK